MTIRTVVFLGREVSHILRTNDFGIIRKGSSTTVATAYLEMSRRNEKGWSESLTGVSDDLIEVCCNDFHRLELFDMLELSHNPVKQR